MDDEEETKPKEKHVGENADEEGIWEDQEGPEEILALRMRWGLSLECSEPQPTSTKLRLADEILTFLGEAAFENEQAMAAMGTAQNLKEEENVIVAREVGTKCVQPGLGQSTSQGLCAGVRDDGEIPWEQADLEHVVR